MEEVHFVVADRFFSHAEDEDGLGVEGWQALKMAEFGAMNKFTTFMHDKVQIFVPSGILEKLERLTKKGYKTLLRRSRSSAGDLVGHVSIAFAGVIFEFYNILEGLTEREAEEKGFHEWTAEECPKAHLIKGNLTAMQKYVDEAAVTDSQTFNGVWTSISTSVASFNDLALRNMEDLTKAHVERDDGDEEDSCTVVTSSWENAASKEFEETSGTVMEWRQVYNENYQTFDDGNWRLADYQAYISRVHEKYLSRPDKEGALWRNWDHYLDTHVGLRYTFIEGMVEETEKLHETFLENNIYLGRRSIKDDGDHYYCGCKLLSLSSRLSPLISSLRTALTVMCVS